MGTFVWTKMGAEGGQSLRRIVAIKEAERQAGGGVFWWGVGNSLGPAVRQEAKRSGGTLAVVFSEMITRAKRADSHPDHVCLWETWCDPDGNVIDIPEHVLEWSKGENAKKSHYALVCRSDVPLVIDEDVPFDPAVCRTLAGKCPGASQVTALLEEGPDADHSRGVYWRSFQATLVEPWFVKLINPRRLSVEERGLHSSWKHGEDWTTFVRRFRSEPPIT